MKKVSSKDLISKLEQQVENHLAIAITSYQNLDEETLLKPPLDGGWSIAQVLDHLNGYGDFYLPQIDKGLEKHYEKNAYFKSSFFGAYFTRMMEPETGKMKIKAFKKHTPLRDLEAQNVVASFINQQEELLIHLRKAAGTDLNKVKIPLSIARWYKLPLGDVFQFLIAHDERHIQQANRVLVELEASLDA